MLPAFIDIILADLIKILRRPRGHALIENRFIICIFIENSCTSSARFYFQIYVPSDDRPTDGHATKIINVNCLF